MTPSTKRSLSTCPGSISERCIIRLQEKRCDEAAEETLEEILLLPIRFHEVGRQDVLRAAETKLKFALSYADAFAVALAQSLDGTIPTGDPEILNVDLGIKVRKLERH